MPTTRTRSRCFNGATTLGSWKRFAYTPSLRTWKRLQGGHDAGVVEKGMFGGRRDEARRFNGATTLGSWKRPPGRRGRAVEQGFNGATTLGSWKRKLGIGGGWWHDAASMGPRRWGRGKDIPI